jgi:hypothetical protein
MSFFLSNCNSQKQHKCYSESTFRGAMGIVKNSLDEDSFFLWLNNSNFVRANQTLKSSNDTSEHSIEDISYRHYRIEEIKNEKTQKELMLLLLESYKPGKTRLSVCISQIVELESKYLNILLSFDTLKRNKLYAEFQSFLTLYPTSRRVKWLWAEINFNLEKYMIAIPFYKQFIGMHYYETNSLKRMIEYYYDNNKDSACYYSKILSTKFPEEPNAGILFCQNLAKEKFNEEYKKCMSSYNKADSIKAQIALGQYFLNKHLFFECDSLYSAYSLFHSKNPDYVRDTLKIWEQGEFYDLHARSLFLQKKFESLLKFVVVDVGRSNKIDINKEDDFENLIKKYYKDYIGNGSASGFDLFYSQNFKYLKGDGSSVKFL